MEVGLVLVNLKEVVDFFWYIERLNLSVVST